MVLINSNIELCHSLLLVAQKVLFKEFLLRLRRLLLYLRFRYWLDPLHSKEMYLLKCVPRMQFVLRV